MFCFELCLFSISLFKLAIWSLIKLLIWINYLSNYPVLWEVPLLTQTDDEAHCSMFDACHRYLMTEDDVYNFFKSNFDRHFKEPNAPFPMFGHASWMIHPALNFRKRGENHYPERISIDILNFCSYVAIIIEV